MAPTDLADAIETYQRAGQAALETQSVTRSWYQVHVEFPEWTAAETTAVTDLGPRLHRLQESGVIAAWWFIRKAPCWRLRMRAGCADGAKMRTAISHVLEELNSAGLISRCFPALYEPEVFVFGGGVGMDIAHDLFCADSGHILAYLGAKEPRIGGRELSVLLSTTLFSAARQEWFECGDVWRRVREMRPILADTPIKDVTQLASGIRKLLTSDARPAGALFGAEGPLAFATEWAAAFNHAGQALAAAADDGGLERGTRDILAHHVIFHWNRMGLPYRTQSILAHAAEIAIFG